MLDTVHMKKEKIPFCSPFEAIAIASFATVSLSITITFWKQVNEIFYIMYERNINA